MSRKIHDVHPVPVSIRRGKHPSWPDSVDTFDTYTPGIIED
jgi:hypothetical protein